MFNSFDIIGLYNRVRQIPFGYQAPRNPDFLITKNKGVCSEKNMFLARELRNLGLAVRFLLIKFDWNELPVPKNIIALRRSHLDWHLALKTRINDKWICIDASWDPSLESLGFTGTKNWDGISDTKLAVKPLKIIPVPFVAYYIFKKILRWRENNETQFQTAFNLYLDTNRASNNISFGPNIQRH